MNTWIVAVDGILVAIFATGPLQAGYIASALYPEAISVYVHTENFATLRIPERLIEEVRAD